MVSFPFLSSCCIYSHLSYRRARPHRTKSYFDASSSLVPVQEPGINLPNLICCYLGVFSNRRSLFGIFSPLIGHYLLCASPCVGILLFCPRSSSLLNVRLSACQFLTFICPIWLPSLVGGFHLHHVEIHATRTQASSRSPNTRCSFSYGLSSSLVFFVFPVTSLLLRIHVRFQYGTSTHSCSI